MFIITGFGNPGREYRLSRHNIGFMAIDQVAQDFGIRMMRMQSRAIIGIGDIEGQKVLLAKPQTFMNLSGQSVAALVKYYKTPLEQVLVIHDDMDLPFETLRMRPSGGSAGQKGLASTIERLGTQDFPRLRIGIGHPPGRMETKDYVLESFSSSEQNGLSVVLQHASAAVRLFIKDGIQTAMNQFNGMVERE